VLSNGRLNIIDYKSGDNKLDPAEIRAGYRLQLMLYMKAARGEEKEPAGVFYFHIHDPRIEGESVEGATGDTLMEKLQGQLRKAFFLKGILVNKDNNVEEVAGEFEKQSEVMPVSMSKNGLKGTAASILMTEEEFQALSLEVDAKLEELADQMIGGEIPISPMRTKTSKPCDFCDFKSVCRFDTEFDGCQYRQV
jgi:ATP-dependent helicase/nuclease subunit B